MDGSQAITIGSWGELKRATVSWLCDEIILVGCINLVVANWPKKAAVKCLSRYIMISRFLSK